MSKRKVTNFAPERTGKEILKVKIDPVAGFMAMRRKLPKFKNRILFKAIQKNRV